MNVRRCRCNTADIQTVLHSHHHFILMKWFERKCLTFTPHAGGGVNVRLCICKTADIQTILHTLQPIFWWSDWNVSVLHSHRLTFTPDIYYADKYHADGSTMLTTTMLTSTMLISTILTYTILMYIVLTSTMLMTTTLNSTMLTNTMLTVLPCWQLPCWHLPCWYLPYWHIPFSCIQGVFFSIRSLLIHSKIAIFRPIRSFDPSISWVSNTLSGEKDRIGLTFLRFAPEILRKKVLIQQFRIFWN